MSPTPTPPQGSVSDQFEPEEATKKDWLTVLKEFKQRGAVYCLW